MLRLPATYIGETGKDLYKPISLPLSFLSVAPEEKSSRRQQHQSDDKTNRYVNNHTSCWIVLISQGNFGLSCAAEVFILWPCWDKNRPFRYTLFKGTQSANAHAHPFNTFLKSQKSSRIAYKQLIANKSEKPISCIDKWHKDIHSSTDKNADWRNVFQAANTCTTSSKLIDFNFRFLHRRLPTNSYLQKIGVKEDGKCTFCHDEKEDLTHLFWKCQKTKNFWDNFSIWLQSCQILQPGSYLDMTTALGLTPDSSSFKLHINFCCLIAKNFIWICRSKECFPIHNNFLFYLRHIYQLENKTPRNTKKWKPFFSSLGLVS